MMIGRNMMLVIAVTVLVLAILLAALAMGGPACCECAYDEQDVLRCR